MLCASLFFICFFFTGLTTITTLLYNWQLYFPTLFCDIIQRDFPSLVNTSNRSPFLHDERSLLKKNKQNLLSRRYAVHFSIYLLQCNVLPPVYTVHFFIHLLQCTSLVQCTFTQCTSPLIYCSAMHSKQK